MTEGWTHKAVELVEHIDAHDVVILIARDWGR